MSDQEESERNRRQSFRLEDTVTFRIRTLDDNDVEAISSDFNGFRLRYCMQSHLQNQKEVRRPKIIRIRKSNPDIAEYLETLEGQIAQLAERMDESNESSGGMVEFTGRANLSATGIRFRTDLPLVAESTIEIGLVLSTQNTNVVMLGKVMRCEDRPNGKIAVSVHYTHIHPEDAEAIMRHLAKLQQLELQSRQGIG